MAWAFRSIGSLVTHFNGAMTASAPAGFQAGDFLRLDAFKTPGAITIPDLTSYGFVQLTLNTLYTYMVIWGKIAAGGDTMPTFTFGTDFAGCYCSAYTGGPSSITGIADQTSVEKQISSGSGIQFSSFSAPPSDGDLILGLGSRSGGSATGVSFGSSTPYTTRGVWTADSRPHVIVMDWIQGASASSSVVSVNTSPSDSPNQTAGSELVFLQAASAAAIPYPPTSLGGMNVQVCQ